MKRVNKLLASAIFLTLFSGLTVVAQDQTSACQVLLPQIAGSYEGECKKGLAEGMGKAQGIDFYEGYFKKGYPDGHGKYAWKDGATF